MESRRYGILCLLVAVCWTLTVATVVVGVVVGIYSALLGVSTVLTPSPSDEQNVRFTAGVLMTVVVGAVALALLTMVLDAVVAVMSIRRIGGREQPSVVPAISLVAAVVSTVVPVLLIALALAAGALEQQEVASGAWWLLAGTIVALAPWTRAAQLIGGIIETATSPARARPPGVGPLP